MGRPRKEGDRIRWKNGIAYATVYVDGRPVERSTGARTEAEAKSVLDGWRREAGDRGREAAARTTLNDALSLLLEDREAKVRSGDRSDATVEFYTGKAGILIEFFGREFPIASAWQRDSAASWDFIRWRRTTDVLDRTIKKELGVLRTALHLAQEQGRFDGRPDLAVPASFDPETPTSDRSPTRPEILKLIPELAPDPAAITCFILATSAEWSALERATRTDLPDLTSERPQVNVRGTKNEDRDRLVPISTDEQHTLMAFVARHAAGGEEGPLFPTLANYRRALAEACERAGIEHMSTHSLRHAAGQWLLDLGVPVELVSRILGHTSTSMTETVYARVKKEAVGDRILDVIDPRYARTATKARRKADRTVATIKKVPEPRKRVTYVVGDQEKTLAEWARATTIPKATLHHRVVTCGMSMTDAIALGRGTRGRPLTEISGVRYRRETDAKRMDESLPKWTVRPPRPSSDQQDFLLFTVPRDRIELSTRGFSIRCSTN